MSYRLKRRLIIVAIVIVFAALVLFVFGSLTPQMPESLSRLIFFRQIKIFVLRTTVL